MIRSLVRGVSKQSCWEKTISSVVGEAEEVVGGDVEVDAKIIESFYRRDGLALFVIVDALFGYIYGAGYFNLRLSAGFEHVVESFGKNHINILAETVSFYLTVS